MNTLQGLPMLSQYKKLLLTGEEKHAWSILHEFFEAFDDEGPKELLWFMLCGTMKLSDDDINAKDRNDLLFFYEYCLPFFKAVHVLYTLKEQGGKKKKK